MADGSRLGSSVASQVPFHDLCSLLEKVHCAKGTEKKKLILKTFVDSWRETHNKLYGNTMTDDSFFPVMRLLLPQFDKERPAYGMKETALAKHYIEILSISKDSLDAKKLMNFKAPTHAMKDAGDFAMVAYFVLKNRCPEKGSLSIKQVNDLLDEVALGNADHKKTNVKKALQGLLRNTSALEQKWLIRMILKELKVGISEKSIFDVYHPDAMDLYNVCSILSKVCEDLRDPTIRKNDSEITLFSAFKPMLGQRADVEEVEKLMNEQAFVIETKLDGERFMLHKQDNLFKYFSRGSNEYTSTFGGSPDEGHLTPFIAGAFSSKVKSCILDGEMLAFNGSNDLAFVSKGANIDFKSAKTYSDDSGLHPCFVVFDVLFVNGKSIASLPFKERQAYLEKVFTPVSGRIQLVESQNGENKQDVIKALNEAVDKYEEGLVIKSPMSIYQPNVRNGSGWLKIKPEYVDGLSDELDVLIIGGYFGVGSRGGMVSHFLCGVAVPPEISGEKPTTFYSFCKVFAVDGASILLMKAVLGQDHFDLGDLVGSGYSISELKELCRQLHPHWKKFDTSRLPSSVVMANGFKEKPDVWIEPCKSKIVQIKAAEIVQSDNYKTGQTLRFPRLEKIRDDKSWFECLDLNELEKLRTVAKGKLTYQHTTIDEPAPKKRKRVVTRVERPLTVARHFETVDASAVQEKSQIFESKEFYIVNGPSDCGKVQLEKKVLENGGTVVQNPGDETFCVIAHKTNVRVRNIIKQEAFDVVYASWLTECLDNYKLLPWLPSHMLYTSPKTEEKFALDYDANGDSYTKDTNIESLKDIFERITDKQTIVKLTSSEIAEVESRYFPDSPLGLFRQYRFYLDQFSEIGHPETKIPNCSLDLQALELRFYGGQLSQEFDDGVTHVIVNHRDLSRLPLIQQILHDRPRKAHVVTETWVTESIEAGKVLKERSYGPRDT